MHEFSICQRIMDEVIRNKDVHLFKSVKSVRISLSSQSCIDEEALQFAFEICKKNSCAEDATLVIETIPTEIYCSKCKTTQYIQSPFGCCPNCGMFDYVVMTKQAIIMKNLEVV